MNTANFIKILVDDEICNPYLDVFLKYMEPAKEPFLRSFWEPIGYGDNISIDTIKKNFKIVAGGTHARERVNSLINARYARSHLVKTFAFAVPSANAIKAIRELDTPIVEIGAGGGYWASLLRQVGVTVIAVDKEPWEATWTPVVLGNHQTALDIACGLPNPALFMCWPPYGAEWPERALKHWRGDTLIHVGEHFGCTARDGFYARLPVEIDEEKHGWTLTREISIPQWYGARDYMSIYKR